MTFGPSAHGDTPPPLRHADVLNEWSLTCSPASGNKKSHKTFAAGLTFAKHYFSLRLIAKWVENISQGELFGLLSNFDAKPDPNFGLT